MNISLAMAVGGNRMKNMVAVIGIIPSTNPTGTEISKSTMKVITMPMIIRCLFQIELWASRRSLMSLKMR